VALLVAILAMGFRLLINDEVYRWDMAKEWARHPFLAPGDHIWLGGFFYLTGAAMRLFGHSFAFGKIFPLIFSLLGIAGLYALVLELFRSRTAAFCAAFALAAGAVHSWLSASLMPETMSIAFSLWGLYFLARGEAGGGGGGEGVRAALPSLLGAFLVGCAASFRYECWLFAGACGLVWSLRFLRLLRREKRNARHLTVTIAGLFLFGFYILFWIALGWIRKGDPLLFLHNSSEQTIRAPNPLAYLWEGIRPDDPWTFALGLLGAALLLAFGRARERCFAGILLIFSVLFVYIQGVGTAISVYRITQVWRALLLAAAPFPLVLAARWIRRPGAEKAARAALFIAAAAYFAHQAPRLVQFKLWGFSNGSWAVAQWIRHEANNPVYFKRFPGVRPGIHVLETRPVEDSTEYLVMAYMSSYEPFTKGRDVPPSADLLLTASDARTLPEGWREAFHLGEWTLSEKTPGP